MIDVTLEITRKCPLNCLFCSSNGGEPLPNELGLNEWFKVIDEAISLGATSFLISGGEPFSSPFVKQICKYISNNNAHFTIYSCGNKIENNQLVPLEKNDFVFLNNLNSANIIFNLQGPTKAVHDKVTNVRGSFENVLSSISHAVNLGIKTEIHFVPILFNYKFLPELVSLSKDLEISRVSVLRFVPQGRGKKNESRIKLREDALIELKSILSNFNDDQSFVRIGNPFSPFGFPRKNNCNAARDRMTIRYDGQVVPCEAMKFLAENYKDNDLKRHSLEYIWTRSDLFTQIRSFHSLITKSNCQNCASLSNCKGGCLAQRLVDHQSLKEGIDPLCLSVAGIKV